MKLKFTDLCMVVLAVGVYYAEVEQYLRYGVWFLCGFYILGRLLELVRKTK
ncbi:hypothetical protein LQE88_10440 [Acidaminococcus sp. NSJ-142]|uniref:hypothetical protein n=1 Tax=Acidaminococcus TaxID=904 RepID=UPI00131472F3|nr:MULTISPECIES: hypothetical protein [Acidaminococcus]MCD2436396.1 hypothetical protein [Acidaminococcus hominis]MCH4095839.1 hypothetical protein [Acidaminococcus provencensis]